ncbi:MAG TPA: formyltetrahydrofolate deformylase [Steroidobacteraceae bacterium]|nr:formyltetrahydrofolate deformylase [Steroidobacteraceae bacterium]
MPRFTLAMSCPDRRGIVAAIGAFIAECSGSIVEAAHFVDSLSQRSFMRTTFSGDALPSLETLRAQFAAVSARYDMDWRLHPAEHRCKALIAVSRQGHCLNSLLHRWSIGTLPVDIVGVVSNHDTHARLVAWHGLPFHHFPIEPGRKQEQEARILALFESSGAELLVLARYMQVLSDEACRRLAGRCINIHHSFLPGFKGARPYHQAYERGVKLIGATAHYATADLDEGPIIEQSVHRVDHTKGPEALAEIGHDLEAAVLNNAVRWHAEHRVFITGNRTVILHS